ncbi:MAG: RrF2 family transcriptional regulator [Christensenellales bacterium]
MKLSSKARYGLKAMCYLAQKEAYGDNVVSLSAVAEDIGVSDKYLEQLFATLKKAELVSSSRGASGGYVLPRAADEISVGEILRALEDGLVIVDCVSGECSNQCGNSSGCQCTTHGVWDKLYKTINDCLDGMSLASVIARE